jgi:hypothetical protein
MRCVLVASVAVVNVVWCLRAWLCALHRISTAPSFWQVRHQTHLGNETARFRVRYATVCLCRYVYCAAVVAAAVDRVSLQSSTAASHCNSSRSARPYFTTFVCLFLALPTGGRADADVQRPHAHLRGQGGRGQLGAAAGQVQLQERLHQALRYDTLLHVRTLLCRILVGVLSCAMQAFVPSGTNGRGSALYEVFC